MLKDSGQLTMNLSPYQRLYDVIIPADHVLKKLKENIDYQYEGFSPYRAINIIKIGHISPSPPKKPQVYFLKKVS